VSVVQLHLVVQYHDGRREERDLGDGTWSIGRARDNWLCPLDTALSRQHVRLEVKEGSVWLEALPTANGTRVNGRLVEGRHQLRIGDEIFAGRTLLQVQAGPRQDQRRQQATVDLGDELADSGQRLVAVSPRMCELLEQCKRLAASDLPVLITGESGTGKEVLAQHLHQLSPRRDGPFEIVNCPALPASLVEPELFGVEHGVATGVSRRPGRLEQADGGTLMLDEIGDLAAEAQAKLLRFLQDQTIERVGGRKPLQLDVRVIAATNRDPEEAIASGALRSDLYFRIAALHIEIPPLRERPEDIPALVDYFLQRQQASHMELDPQARQQLLAYQFAGNVRELEAIVARAALLARNSLITVDDLGLRTGAEPAGDTVTIAGTAQELLAALVREEIDFWEGVYRPFQARELPRAVVKELVARGLERSGGTVKALAALLHTEDRYRKLLDFLRNNRLMP
jgi:transcriptional regulator with PAS, ATPase and Fis domain